MHCRTGNTLNLLLDSKNFDVSNVEKQSESKIKPQLAPNRFRVK